MLATPTVCFAGINGYTQETFGRKNKIKKLLQKRFSHKTIPKVVSMSLNGDNYEN